MFRLALGPKFGSATDVLRSRLNVIDIVNSIKATGMCVAYYVIVNFYLYGIGMTE